MIKVDLDALCRLSGTPTTSGLSPFGSAAQRFLREQSLPRPQHLGMRLTEELSQRLRAHDLPEEVVTLAWELVQMAPGLDERETRGLLYLCTIVLLDLRQGSTRTPIAGPAGHGHLQAVLRTWVIDVQERSQILQDAARVLELRRAPTLIGTHAEDYTPLIIVDDHIYAQRMLRLEVKVAEILATRARTKTGLAGTDARKWLEAVLARPSMIAGKPLVLSSEQGAAVQQALQQKLIVICGGPGTGKTSIVVALLRALVRSGVQPADIALAAPTGKAAHRMAEAVRTGLQTIEDPAPEDDDLSAHTPDPMTLHRLLGYLPSRDSFAHHENNRLSQQVIVVDESSMIDLELMERLARALPDEARLILLGDAEQLPSVHAGAVLKDLRAAQSGLTVQLHTSYRMRTENPAGRSILLAAAAINAGDPRELLGTESTEGRLARYTKVQDLPLSGAALLAGNDPASLTRALLPRWEQAWRSPALQSATRRPYHFSKGGFRPEDIEQLELIEQTLASRKLLCITKNPGFPTGSEAINALVHQRRVAALGLEGAVDFLPGEPVMMLHNDYARGLFNGDQGVVLRVGIDQDAVTPMLVFRTDRGFAPFGLAQLRPRITLAHAMTVHKAQGSEMDHVAVLLPKMDLPLLTREILYTAVTRAKLSVTLVGHPELVARATRRAVVRHSGVGHRLAKLLNQDEPP